MTSSTDKIIENAANYVRRLSPEGRLAAQRARDLRNARIRRAISRSILTSTGWLAGFGIADLAHLVTLTPGVILLNIGGVLGMISYSIYSSKTKPIKYPEITPGSKDLSDIVNDIAFWYSNIPGMPNVTIYQTMSILRSALVGFTLDSPEAKLVQTLLCEDLKKLVENYLSIPDNLRKKAVGKDLTPYEQLKQGIQVIKFELDKLIDRHYQQETEALAQQSAYLNLKYGSDND